MSGTVIRDAATYSEMLKPRPAQEAAESVKAFLDDVRALRIKHRIADTVTIAQVEVEGVGPMVSYGHNGASENVLPMLAQVFNTERNRLIQVVDSMVPPLVKKPRTKRGRKEAPGE
jgi:hypothetical protein